MMRLVSLFALGASLALAQGPLHLTVATEGVPEGDGYYPSSLALTDTPPFGLRKLPELRNKRRMFGELRFGPKGHATTRIVVLDEPEDQVHHLYFDADGDGDLTNDPPVAWTAKPYKGGPEDKPLDLAMHEGQATVTLPLLGGRHTLKLRFYRFDAKDPNRPGQRSSLAYYLDYALKGTANLGGRTYPIMLRDRHNIADFSRTAVTDANTYPMDIDLNGDGRYTAPAEVRETLAPFNIGGTTYEFTGWTADGSKLAIRKSAQHAEAMPVPPAIVSSTNGSPFPPVKGTAMGGQTIDVPGGYKGKLLLVDFWATWCGPCIAEAPNMVAAYEKFHGKGLEVLGVSLDNPGSEAKIKEVTQDKGMVWPQLYDGKNFSTPMFQLLGLGGIPSVFLVDGDSGKILAQDEELRGKTLAETLERVLAEKGKAAGR